MVTCHCGPLADAEKAMRPLKQFGSPVLDAVGPMPYCQLNGMLDAGYPKGALNYWKSNFLAELSDDCDRHDDRVLRAVPHPDGPAAPRALPWRGDPGRCRATRPSRTAPEGYNFLVLCAMDGPDDDRSLHRLGAGNLCSRWSPSSPPAAT